MEAEEKLNSLLREFENALRNRRMEDAEMKLKEAERYAYVLGINLEEQRRTLEAAKRELVECEIKKLLAEAKEKLKEGDFDTVVRLYAKAKELSTRYEILCEKVEGFGRRLEGTLDRAISLGDTLLSEGKLTEAIEVYERILPIAEVFKRDEPLRRRLANAKKVMEREKMLSELRELMTKADDSLNRKDYFSAVSALKSALEIARKLGMEREVRRRLEELRLRAENLVKRGDIAFESGNYTEALKFYTEVLPLLRALGERTGSIEDKVMYIENRERLKLLRKSVKFEIPNELPHGTETNVSIIITNKFSHELVVGVDLSKNTKYFELSRERVEFPPIEPGTTIGEEVAIRPKFIGDFEFTVRVKSNLGSFEEAFRIKVVKESGFKKPLVATAKTPLLNPLEALRDRYSDFQYIGEGGFARVYMAKRRDGKVVALKIPKALDPAIGRAFVREIANWMHLKHPNIVELYDVNVVPIPYLEMEYCESSLEKLPLPLSPDEASLIIFNIADGLKYAHSKGIIHRDLKPSNILLKKGLPKISDWGLSKVLGESMSTTTTTSFTPYYAAPEQVDKKFGHTDERTDIWQLGVIFYQLVTGRLPFEGSLSQVIMGILGTKPAPPSKLNPEAEKVEPIILKMLAKRKGTRAWKSFRVIWQRF